MSGVFLLDVLGILSGDSETQVLSEQLDDHDVRFRRM